MHYDAILFDMDGVLVTGTHTISSVYHRATAEMVEAFGVGVASEWTSDLQNPDSVVDFRRACSRWGLPDEAAWAYRERAATGIERDRIQSGERTAFPDTDVLAALADRYTIGVVSNNRHDTVGFCVEYFDWGDHVTTYRGRFPTLAEYDRMKPDPSFLSWTVDRLDATAPLFVGDRVSDVLTAERVGCDAAMIARSGTDRPRSGDPTFHLSSLLELLELHENGWND